MRFEPTKLSGNYLVYPEVKSDARGWFMRTYDQDLFREIGHHQPWVQMNHSFTTAKGQVRGMHFQKHPFGEIKLVRCIRGAVWDVAVDLREKSPTYLQWFAAELSPQNNAMMYIPAGFAHGFQVLEEASELIYLHSTEYRKEAEGGIRYDDPKLNIQWPLNTHGLSERDLSFPLIDNHFKSSY